MKIGLLITIILSLVLSGCGLQQNDDFEKKVKCYELGKQYVDRLQKEENGKDQRELGTMGPGYYEFVMSVYSKEAKSCLLNYKYSKGINSSIIVDILSNKLISNYIESSGVDGYHDDLLKYLNSIQDEGYYGIINGSSLIKK